MGWNEGVRTLWYCFLVVAVGTALMGLGAGMLLGRWLHRRRWERTFQRDRAELQDVKDEFAAATRAAQEARVVGQPILPSDLPDNRDGECYEIPVRQRVKREPPKKGVALKRSIELVNVFVILLTDNTWTGQVYVVKITPDLNRATLPGEGQQFLRVDGIIRELRRDREQKVSPASVVLSRADPEVVESEEVFLPLTRAVS